MKAEEKKEGMISWVIVFTIVKANYVHLPFRRIHYPSHEEDVPVFFVQNEEEEGVGDGDFRRKALR